MVLPCEDNVLRGIAQDRPSYRVARYENLPLDIERAIAGIIEREVELLRRLDLLKRELEIRYDFSPYAAFKTIDRYTEGTLTVCNITQFLRSQAYYPSEREVLSIIRRMDTSCAAKVSYSDFADFTRGHGSSDFSAHQSFCESPSKSKSLRSHSAGRNGQSLKKKSLDNSLSKARSSSCVR